MNRTCPCGAKLSRHNPSSVCGPCRLGSIDDRLREARLDARFEEAWDLQRQVWRANQRKRFKDLVSEESDPYREGKRGSGEGSSEVLEAAA